MSKFDWPMNTETEEQIVERGANAARVMALALKTLRKPDVPLCLATLDVHGDGPRPVDSQAEAHATIGAFMMAAKAMAASLGIQVSVAAMATHKEDETKPIVGVDAWAVDHFALAQLQEIAAVATRTSHRHKLQDEIDRLESACVGARESGEKMAGPLFDRSRVTK